MKRLLISLGVALALPVLAQTPAPSVKPEKASTKKAAPVAKSKIVVMTRDELRVCLKHKAADSAESAAIESEKVKFQEERVGVIADKDALLKQSMEIETAAKSIVAERNELMEAQKEFEKPAAKADLKAAETKRAEFNARADANGKKIETYNAEKNIFNKAKDALDVRIEASNVRGKALQTRADKLNDSVDDWRATCANKPYEVADEIAVKKELKQAQ
jgi:chromosome segregation ATPase